MRCAAVAFLSAALLNGVFAASASFQVFPDYGKPVVYEDQAFNAEVLVTPSNSYDSSRLSGAVFYMGSGGERIDLGSVFGFVAGSASAGIYASATLGGIPKSGTYTLTVEGTVEHLGYFNNSSEPVWGRPENFTATSSVTVSEVPLDDPDAALSNMDNAIVGQLGLSNASYNNNWFDPRTIKIEIHQSFTTGNQQAFLDHLTIRDRKSGDAPIYYVRLLGPSTDRLLTRAQSVGKYYTKYVPWQSDGVLILQPNTKYWIVMEPHVVPPFSAIFDATSDQLNYRSSLGWVAGETLLVTKDSGGYVGDGYDMVYYPPTAAAAASAVSPLFSISATPTGGYDGFPLAGAATKLPFDTSTAARWSAEGNAWVVDRSVSKDGVDSVKAQAIDGQSTYREYTVTGPAVVDFWWTVSSEQLYDTFSYSLNGTNQETISGEVDWTYRTLTLPAGSHTIRWTYTKDRSDAVGQDAGWLDDFAVYPATASLQVRDGATVLSGATTMDFGSADLGSAGFTKSLTFVNQGYVPLEVQLSLPQGSPFTFDGGFVTYGLLIGRGESVDVPIRLATTAAGNRSAQLTISAPDSTVAPPSITLAGFVRGPDIGLTQGATTLTSGQTFDTGLAPRTVEFTIRNNGNVGDLVISGISATGNFQITQQPATTIPPQGSTTFKVLAQSIASGTQTGSVRITSNAANLAEFSLPLISKSLTGIAQGIADGSMATSGTGGAVGWDFATTQLPSGQSGQALKTGVTPNNGGSVLEFTTQTAGVLSWSWKVGSQENFDWLLCEVDGQEVAGISTKNGVWQTQVVQVPAGANVRWIYRKDTSASAGEDAGYLADLEFRSATANQSFSQWGQTHGILDPQQRVPKSGMRAKFAWLGGFDPAFSLTAGHHLPFMEAGSLKYRFPISKTADGTQQILFSGDMSAWTTRRFSQRVVSEDANRMVIEATAPSGTKGFFKVVGSGDTSMVWVEGGTLPQASELAGTTVATFQIGKTEVTWAEWQEVRDWAVGRGYGDLAAVGAGSAGNHPVHSVSWEDAVKWCNAKSEKEGLQPVYLMDGSVYRTGGTFWFGGNVSVDPSANGYRLPREAEWEWAASGGGTSQGYVYSGGSDLNSVGWYWDSSVGAAVGLGWGRGTWPVAQRTANELGLYDMSGNLAEWCWDATANYDTWRRLRGGSWEAPQDECGVFARSGRYASHGYYPAERINRAGFRVARNAED